MLLLLVNYGPEKPLRLARQSMDSSSGVPTFVCERYQPNQRDNRRKTYRYCARPIYHGDRHARLPYIPLVLMIIDHSCTYPSEVTPTECKIHEKTRYPPALLANLVHSRSRLPFKDPVRCLHFPTDSSKLLDDGGGTLVGALGERDMRRDFHK